MSNSRSSSQESQRIFNFKQDSVSKQQYVLPPVILDEDILKKHTLDGVIEPAILSRRKLRSQVEVYCLTRLMWTMGFPDFPNKVIFAQELEDYALTHDIIIVYQVSDDNFWFGSTDPKIYLDLRKFLVTGTHDHARKVTHCHLGFEPNNFLDCSKLAIAMPPKPRRNDRKQIPNPQQVQNKSTSKPRYYKKKVDKDLNRVTEKLNKVAVQVNEVKQEVEPKLKRTRYQSRSMNRSIRTRFSNYNQMVPEAQNLLQMLANPYNASHLTRFPDGFAKDVAILKQTTTLQPSVNVVASFGYLSVIHAGSSHNQVMVSQPGFQSLTEFTIAALRILQNNESDLGDSVASACNGGPTVASTLTNAQTLVVPLHTGFTSIENANRFQVNGLYPSCALYSPSEVYPVGSTSNMSIPVGVISSLPGSSAFALARDVQINVSIAGQVTTTGNITVYAHCATNTSSAILTVGTFAVSASSDFSETVTENVTATNADRLYGITIVTDVTAVISFKSIDVKILWNAYDSTTALGAVCPFSCYVGYQSACRGSILGSANSERCIASAMLYSDSTNALNVQSHLYVEQLKQGTYPAESSVYGLSSASNNAKVMVNPEKFGCYSAPFKIKDITTSSFYGVGDDWKGFDPYTVTYLRVPNTVVISVRLQVCDILELKTKEQQLWTLGTMLKNDALITVVQKTFTEKPILTENPFHFSDIGKFIKKGLSILPSILPQYAPQIGAASLLADSFL